MGVSGGRKGVAGEILTPMGSVGGGISRWRTWRRLLPLLPASWESLPKPLIPQPVASETVQVLGARLLLPKSEKKSLSPVWEWRGSE